eukprot:3423061-Amphidinium_carterae.1
MQSSCLQHGTGMPSALERTQPHMPQQRLQWQDHRMPPYMHKRGQWQQHCGVKGTCMSNDVATKQKRDWNNQVDGAARAFTHPTMFPRYPGKSCTKQQDTTAAASVGDSVLYVRKWRSESFSVLIFGSASRTRSVASPGEAASSRHCLCTRNHGHRPSRRKPVSRSAIHQKIAPPESHCIELI